MAVANAPTPAVSGVRIIGRTVASRLPIFGSNAHSLIISLQRPPRAAPENSYHSTSGCARARWYNPCVFLALVCVRPVHGLSFVQRNWGTLMALVPSPQWLDTGNNAWQLAAATFVGLQSIPGLTVLYGGIVKKKWAINSAFMAIYAFASVLVVWILFDYNMAFGEQWFPFLGKPGLATSASFTTGQAIVPAAASGMPALTFPMATLIFFQFVFAAITVIILAGSVLGRMNFTAWMIFCPVWMTLVYTVGAFSLWGG
ncbi:MAG: hypothetical protein ACXU87_17155, partial [Xanthobacteraceae bacterium]